jgi:hypothetical protein
VPTEGESRVDRFKNLVPRWIDSMGEVLRLADPELARVWQMPFRIARAHMSTHPGAPPDPACKSCAVAQALIFLEDVTVRNFDDLRRAAKLTTRLHDQVTRSVQRYEEELQGLSLGKPCSQDLRLVVHRGEEFLLQAQNTVAAISNVLNDEPAYSGSFSRKDPYALLDTVTWRLLPSFSDVEIAAMIPDGGPPETAVQRVSNRRLKWTQSRVAPSARRPSRSKS